MADNGDSDDNAGTPPPLRPNQGPTRPPTPPPLRPNQGPTSSVPPPLRPNQGPTTPPPPPLRPNQGPTTPPPPPPEPEPPAPEPEPPAEPVVPEWQPPTGGWQPPTFDATPPPPPPPPPGGRIRRQDPATTRPRPPTVAEARERDKAARRAAEAAQQAELDAQKRKKTKRRLIGAGAVVGVVGVVALGYWAFSSDDVTARCVEVEDGKEIVVPDSNCSGSPNSSGIFIYSGRQYRYYYGGSGDIGQKISNASTVKPKGATITTKSGTTVQRGGLGSKIGGSSGS